LDQVGTAQVYEKSPFIVPGTCPVVWVEALKMVNGQNGETFIAELHVVQGNEGNPDGTECAWFAPSRFKSSPAAVRKNLAGIAGCEPEAVDAEGAKAAVSAANPFRGTLVKMKAWTTKTKAGNDFTLVEFERLPDEMQAKAAELHSAAGF
jgi:hypothetical protein